MKYVTKHFFFVPLGIFSIIALWVGIDQIVKVEDAGIQTAVVSEVALKEYVSDTLGLSFKYPTHYFLEEKGSTLILTDDTEENRLVREGKAPGREGPMSMTIEVLANKKGALSESIGKFFATSTVGGFVATSSEWSGLYEGTSVVVTRPSSIYVFSVTRIFLEDPILADFERLLETVEFK